MFCSKCGTQYEEGTKFCAGCGAALAQAPAQEPEQPTVQPQVYQQPVQQPYQQPVYQQPVYQQADAGQTEQPAKGLAVASLVLGIVSFFCFAYITGILAVIFGAVAKSKGNRSGMSTAGLICGGIGVVLWILSLLFLPSLFSLLFGQLNVSPF